MKIVEKYSFQDGSKRLEKERPSELAQVIEAIERAQPKAKKGLYSPGDLCNEILEPLYKQGWSIPKREFEIPGNPLYGDGLKNEVGLELQFGKYAFLAWDTLRKIVLFSEKEIYKYGIEVAPMASFRRKMAKGIGSFEQVSEKLEKSGNPDLEIPVLLLGIDVE